MPPSPVPTRLHALIPDPRAQDATVPTLLDVSQFMTTFGGAGLNVKGDPFNAVGDGASHLLSERFTTLAAAQAVYPHATALTNEIDWCAIQGAINSLTNTGGMIFLPIGTYMVHNRLDVLGGVQLHGTGIDYSTVTTAAARASVIKASAAYSSGFGVVRLGTDLSTASGHTGASAFNLVVDAANVGSAAFEMSGRRNYMLFCQAWRGTSKAIAMNGQNGYVLDCVAGNNNVGDTIVINGDDNKIFRSQIREGGTSQVKITSGSDLQIHDNHIFGTSSSGSAKDLWLAGTATVQNVEIVGNIIEGTRQEHILIQPGASTAYRCININGNSFFQVTGWPGGFSSINLDITAASSLIEALNITGNLYNDTGGGINAPSFITKTGAGGSIAGDSVTGNCAADVTAFFGGGYAPLSKAGNVQTPVTRAWVTA